jgi:hypothetical protein
MDDQVNSKEFDFAENFTPYPGPRFKDIGDFSGEEFRDNILEKYFQSNLTIILNVDGVLLSFGPSFLSEAFGQIALKYGYKKFHEIIKVKNDTDKGRFFEKKMNEYVDRELNNKS